MLGIMQLPESFKTFGVEKLGHIAVGEKIQTDVRSFKQN